MKKDEIWKDIQGFEGIYQISNLGRVKSLERYVFCRSKTNPKKIKECIRKLGEDKNGYSVVSLKKNQKTKLGKVHRMVAIAFIDNPDNKEEVNHINGIKNDNRVENLEWSTPKQNSQHRTRTRLTKPILNDEQIKYIQDNAVLGKNQTDCKNSFSELAKRFDVSRATISDIYYKKKLYL